MSHFSGVRSLIFLKSRLKVVRQVFLRELVHIVLVQEVQDVYLPRLVEVEERGGEPLVDVEQGQQPLLHLEAHKVALRLHLRVEEGGERRKQAGELRRPGQFDDAGLQLGRMGRHLVGTALGVRRNNARRCTASYIR